VRGRKGFGLAETAVVIVILGTLAVIAIPNYIRVRKRAMEGAVKGNAHALQLVVEEWSVDHGGMLPALADLDGSLFPNDVYPDNPFTGDPFLIGTTGIFSQGNLGYELIDGIYMIEGYGAAPDAGPGNDGIIARLTNG
jgi:prepilin-type N-terminal cleavage/methylation domain-containing protein